LALLQKNDLVTAQPGDASAFEARRPSTDDDHVTRPRCLRQIGPERLAADEGVLNTGNTAAGVDAINTARVVAEAGSNVVQPLVLGLVREVGVGDQGARHVAQVSLP